jgi:hypothetical protein
MVNRQVAFSFLFRVARNCVRKRRPNSLKVPTDFGGSPVNQSFATPFKVNRKALHAISSGVPCRMRCSRNSGLGLGIQDSGLGSQASGLGIGSWASGLRIQDSGLGRQASGLGIQDSGLGSQASGLGIQDSGLGSQASGLGIQDSGLGSQASGLEIQDSGLGSQASGLGIQASGLGSQASGLGIQALAMGEVCTPHSHRVSFALRIFCRIQKLRVTTLGFFLGIFLSES